MLGMLLAERGPVQYFPERSLPGFRRRRKRRRWDPWCSAHRSAIPPQLNGWLLPPFLVWHTSNSSVLSKKGRHHRRSLRFFWTSSTVRRAWASPDLPEISKRRYSSSVIHAQVPLLQSL